MIAAIESAIASVADCLPAAASVMKCGGRSGKVLAASSRQLSGDSLTEDAPQEMCRKIGKRCDFPDLAAGAAVEIDGKLHIVTSASTDPLGASVSFGLSDALSETPAIYIFTRRIDGVAHRQRQRIDLLAIRLAQPPALAEAAALGDEPSWLVCIATDAWTDLSEPMIGDTIEFTDPKRDWETVRLRVAKVSRHDGWWLLRTRSRGGA